MSSEESHDELPWRTATYSSNGNCVEVAPLPGGRGIAVRDSKNRGQGMLRYTADEWRAFVAGVKDGEFDLV